MSDQQDLDTLGTDLLKGMPEIARFLNEPERRAYYLCEKGLIPVGKLGATWIASKTKLRRHYDKLTGG
jgi:hypothetical protein